MVSGLTEDYKDPILDSHRRFLFLNTGLSK